MSEMNENQWQTAHIMARLLVQAEMDKNELKKATAYLRTCVGAADGGERFFRYLQNLVRGGDRIGHSKRTLDYYRSLDEVCVKYLQPVQSTPQCMLDILGWVGRLMHYYAGKPIAELMDAPIEVTAVSSRQAEIAQAAASQEFSIGQEIDARITRIAGNKVSYEILGVIRLTEKEPKKAEMLAENQEVTVKVLALKEDGSIKSVKYFSCSRDGGG
jgi:hypothetical protein